MSKEATIKLVEKEYKGAKQYTLDLKDVQDGEYIMVEKIFADTKGYPNSIGKMSYPCKVKYNDQEVTMWLFSNTYPQFEEQGGVGDTIKISCKEVKKVNPKTKVKMLVNEYTFECV